MAQIPYIVKLPKKWLNIGGWVHHWLAYIEMVCNDIGQIYHKCIGLVGAKITIINGLQYQLVRSNV